MLGMQKLFNIFNWLKKSDFWEKLERIKNVKDLCVLTYLYHKGLPLRTILLGQARLVTLSKIGCD